MPSARSRESAPVGMDSMFMERLSPMRMTEPLPNCFSIWPSAASNALSRSVSAICLSPLPLLLRLSCDPCRLGGRSLAVTLRRGCDGPRRRDGRSITNMCSYDADPPADGRMAGERSPSPRRFLPKRVVAVTQNRRRSRAKLTGPEAGAREALVFRRRVVVGILLAGPVLGATAALAGPAAATSPSTSASTLYGQAVATTQSWSVHYNSASTQSKQTLLVAGDAGPRREAKRSAWARAPSRSS